MTYVVHIVACIVSVGQQCSRLWMIFSYWDAARGEDGYNCLFTSVFPTRTSSLSRDLFPLSTEAYGQALKSIVLFKCPWNKCLDFLKIVLLETVVNWLSFLNPLFRDWLSLNTSSDIFMSFPREDEELSSLIEASRVVLWATPPLSAERSNIRSVNYGDWWWNYCCTFSPIL